MTYTYWADSHCHLDFPDFAEEGVEALVERARLNRIGVMLTISTHTQRLERYTALAEQFPNVWSTIGVHPHQANEDGERDITVDQLCAMAASHPKIVAIGECGLDYHYDYAPREVQHQVFRTHIRAAIDSGLPIIIHARQADDDIIGILKEEGAGTKPLRGVLHCFSSTKALADYALEIGFYVSFSGILTFPKAVELHEICKSIPLEKLLIETDAPFLAPIPYRGRRNEPAFVSHTGRFLAGLHGLDEAKVMDQTTDNFFNLFNKIEGKLHAE
ncbi:MAG: LuxR family transcriptional regulator [Alphaproteobacteria bacterium]|nr:LuxR family transcriptional regulator [Alphaproteobacteria bacterium]